MKSINTQRYEIELCDTERNEAGLQSQAFKIYDLLHKEPVTDSKGNDKFFDFERYSDVPDYVTKYITVYRIEQNYGGAEEGGWYYASYEPVCTIAAHHAQVTDIVELLTKNWAIDDECRNELRVLVELNKHEMVKPRPHYE